jgi:hypothetical protein
MFDLPDRDDEAAKFGALITLAVYGKPAVHLTDVEPLAAPDGQLLPAIAVHLGGGLVEVVGYRPDDLWNLAGAFANAACRLDAALNPPTA